MERGRGFANFTTRGERGRKKKREKERGGELFVREGKTTTVEDGGRWRKLDVSGGKITTVGPWNRRRRVWRNDGPWWAWGLRRSRGRRRTAISGPWPATSRGGVFLQWVTAAAATVAVVVWNRFVFVSYLLFSFNSYFQILGVGWLDFVWLSKKRFIFTNVLWTVTYLNSHGSNFSLKDTNRIMN